MKKTKKPDKSAFEQALYYIMIRPRTEKEIRAYLKGKQYLSAEIDEAVNKLVEYNYINDLEFAHMYIDAKRKSRGRLRIKFELKKTGIDEEFIEQAFSDIQGEEQDAYNLALKYIREKKDWQVNKLYAHLYQKGFPPSVISAAFSLLKDNLGEEVQNRVSGGSGGGDGDY